MSEEINPQNNPPQGRYISGDSKEEEAAIAQARKKKIQEFKLKIEDLQEEQKPADDAAQLHPAFEDLLPKKSEEIRRQDAQVDDVLLYTRQEEAPEDNVITSFSGEEQKQKMDREEKEALKNYKKSEKKRKKAKAERNGCMFKFVWLAMVVLVGAVLGQFFITGVNDLLAVSRSEENESLVVIPENATIDQVAEILTEGGVINEPFFFKAYATLTKSTEGFVPGSYNMDTNMDYEAILNYLLYNSGPREVVSVQFTEGLTVRECGQLLEENRVCGMDEFLEACNSDVFDEEYEFIASISENEDRVYKLEGYLFPDTYIFYVNEDPDEVIRKFLDNFNKKCFKNTTVYPGYEEELSIAQLAELKGIAFEDLINMASLVQAESADENDMYYVSSIFYNRLATDQWGGTNEYGDGELNMLKSDATIYYPYSSQEDIPEDIRDTFHSSYNTYEITNLPPGAICNPGETAIKAALNPKDTGYYYFCHKAATDSEPAQAYYATTYYEHLANMQEAGLTEE